MGALAQKYLEIAKQRNADQAEFLQTVEEVEAITWDD